MRFDGLVDGKVVVITGGGRGLGAAASELFARAGARVAIVARTASEIESLAGRLRAEGHSAIAIQADVSNSEDCQRVVDRVLQEFGELSVLINNAAVAHPFQRIEEVDPAEWVQALNINLIGCFYLMRLALDSFEPTVGGTIINVSSGLAFRTRVGQSAYCVSKAGLEMLGKTLALELEGTEIGVASYDPGMIDTPMQEEQRALDAPALRVDTEMFHLAHREGRLRDPAYVAQGLLWMASKHATEINGQRYSINESDFRDLLEKELGN